MSITIPAGGTTILTILIDTETSYDSMIDLQLQLQNFDLEDVDGNNVVFTNTINSATFDILDSATITANIHTTTPDEQLIQAGEFTTIAQFKFKAIDDSARIQELTLVNVASTFAGNTATGGTARQFAADGAILSLYNSSNVWLGNATLSSGVAIFTPNPTIPLMKDGNGDVITVKANPKDINNENDTNSTIKLAVLNVGETIAGLSTARTFITSDANGLEVATGNVSMTNAVSDTQYVRKTQIVVSSVTAPTNTVLTNSTAKELYKFKVATANGKEALIKKIRLNVTLGGSATLANYELFRGTTKINATDVTATAGAGYVDFEFTGSYANGFEVSNEVTFTFKADVSGVSAGGDSVSVTMDQLSSDATAYDYATTPVVSSFVWSDQAASNTTLTTVDWFTDAHVEALETMTAWDFAATN